MRDLLITTKLQHIAAVLVLTVATAASSAAVAQEAAATAAPEKTAAAAEPVKTAPVQHSEARKSFDWSEWQRIPVFDDGRIKPLDTFADEVVTLVTGRSKWSPADAATPAELESGNPPSKAVYRAPELLFAWITNPEAWVSERIIRCEFRPLRQILHDAKDSVPVEGTFVSLDDVFDWNQSREKGLPVYRSSDLEKRLQEVERAFRTGGTPDSVGETSEDKRINGKVGEMFRHVEAFLSVREARNIHVVPGLDPRVLTKQTNPDERLEAWVSLGALLHPESLQKEPDITMVALMATSQVELLSALHNRNLLSIAPQLSQAQKNRDTLLAQIRKIRPALEASRSAYDKSDASAFASAMRTFAREIRRLGESLDQARNDMVPPEPKSMNFGEVDAIVWSNYTPLELSPNQMRFSSYPPPGSTNVEILYNKYQPFRSAWIYFLVATVVVSLSLMVKWQRTVYLLGLLATLGALAYSTWGFVLRIIIAERPPVTNMYETVIWVSFVVAALGFWFCLLPLTWPGLNWSWKLSGIPLRLKKNSNGKPVGVEVDSLAAEDQHRMLAGAYVPVRIAMSAVRLGIFLWTVWFLTSSKTSFNITSLTPPIYGKAISIGSLGTWCIAITTVVLSSWFLSRAVLAIAGSLITLIPEVKRDSAKVWEQTYARRYFLFGALPVACFGMMLAHFVGMTNPDILNPRVGSIAAVLRNNYWLTIHVLTLVSSYGA
ncbi:MAG: hypothetical protein AB7O26_05085, partial [Planctomycetaceae bacterium]